MTESLRGELIPCALGLHVELIRFLTKMSNRINVVMTF